MREPPKRQTVTFEQLSYSNMLTLNALVELLSEKGVLSKPEIPAWQFGVSARTVGRGAAKLRGERGANR
jgi:hypothetical protein